MFIGCISCYLLFYPIIYSNSVIFPYSFHPFDIAKKYPYEWRNIKFFYFLFFFISYNIFLIKISKKFKLLRNKKNIVKAIENPINNDLSIKVGLNENEDEIHISEKGLYQNILITGTIGSGKTSSAMYPFMKQIMEYKADITDEKIAMLILDVKGNYYDQVLKFARICGRENDLIKIDLSGDFKYNPLDKPNLKPIVLANRLKTILTLFNKNNSESYWLDKAEQVITECIKFCRIYNDGYVDFTELHKLIMFPNYYIEKVEIVKSKFKNGLLNKSDIYNLTSSINFFDKEFFSLDQRTLSILKSEISRITNIFVSDYNVSQVFCPDKDSINFKGFDDFLNNGKIVVLNMNIAEYKNLSKIIATYLKLDFQSEVLNRLSNSKKIRKTAFICDEYQEYVTDTDADFFSQSREAKCISIIATQSYTSLLNTLKEESVVRVIIQNLINKFWFRTDDNFTIEEIQKQIGKEDKEKISTTISENAKQTDYNILTKKLISRDTNISESFNKYYESEYMYDSKFLSQELKTFFCLAFLSNGIDILKPAKLQMIPYFLEKENNILKGFKIDEKK